MDLVRLAGENANLERNRLGCDREIAAAASAGEGRCYAPGDHAEANAGAATDGDRGGSIVLGRIDERDEPDELHIEATRLAGDARQILYAFSVTHQGRPVAEGRAAVVLNTALTS